MPPRERLVHRGRSEGRAAVQAVVAELKLARVGHSITQRHAAQAAGLSQSQYSRLERGEIRGMTIVQAAELLAVVGRRLHVRVYPAGPPIRDAAHVDLLGRLRNVLHPSLSWRTEVPLAIVGDLRAWDARIEGRGWSVGVEAETRPRDLQEVKRRLALKHRDGDVDHVLLLLSASRHNRELVAAFRADLEADYPLPPRLVIQRLTAGADPRGSAVLLL